MLSLSSDGRTCSPNRIARMPMGTFTRNTQCQLATAVIIPPMNGPRVYPVALASVITPRLSPRMREGMSFTQIIGAVDAIMAAPTPWTALNASSMPKLSDRPHMSDPTVKTANPAT